jgi:hypothetical protein
MRIWCGIDWAERHHDIALVDDNGKLVAKRRIADDAAGFRALLTLLVDHGAGPDEPVPIAMGDLPRAARRGAARRRLPALSDQPAGRGPLP